MKSVLNSAEFEDAADDYRARCTVPILVQLSEENVATEVAPPYIAFRIPETSSVTALAKPILDAFSRYVADPKNPPMLWLSRGVHGKDKIPWSMQVGMLAQQMIYLPLL